ncbi:MAG: type I-E CRISPR-associated protein Cse1/CasA [Syntrophales bacterium]
MSRYNLIDEKWIPVRFTGGTRDELGISETLLRSKEIAAIEDHSPLVVAALHRFLLAVLYRALGGPTDIEQAKQLFRDGLPADRVTKYLDDSVDRFFLFHDTYPFYQVPNYEPKEKKGKKQWRAWSAIAAEHNADNAKVLFDHLDIENAGSIPSSKAARWLVACQTFALGGGNSDFQYTKSAPSATAVMVLPLGKNLHDTLLLSLVPENRDVLRADIPIWERKTDELEKLKQGMHKNITGFADLYSWRTRSVRFNLHGDGTTVAELTFASGVGCSSKDFGDPMLAYRIDEKRGKLPIQFLDRGLWRYFDSLLPDNGQLAPRVLAHAAALSRSNPTRFPHSVMVLGQINNKAKIEDWRMELFALPGALAGARLIRTDVRRFLDTAEDTQKWLWAACSSYARDLLSRSGRDPAKKDVKSFIAQMTCIPSYWSILETKFHEILQHYTLGRNPEEIELEWLKAVRGALKDAWSQHRASVSMGDVWAIRAAVKAEEPIGRKMKELGKQIEEFKESLKKEEV